MYDTEIYIYIGVCYEMLGDVVDAKLNYLKAIDINSNNYPAVTRFRKLLKWLSFYIKKSWGKMRKMVLELLL